jgi:hypothetical protein
VALIEHRSAVKDFYDEDEVRRVYYPEAGRFVAEATGASRVPVFDHTIRRRVAGGIDRSRGTPRQRATSVHNDYMVKSGPQNFLGTHWIYSRIWNRLVASQGLLARELRIRKRVRPVTVAPRLGVIEALDDRQRTGRDPTITAEARTWLVALACRKPNRPEGAR